MEAVLQAWADGSQGGGGGGLILLQITALAIQLGSKSLYFSILLKQ